MVDIGGKIGYHVGMLAAIGDSEGVKLYTIADLQELLSVSRITLLAWLDEGRFPSAYKDGEGVTSKWLIPAEDVKAIRKQRIADLDRRIGRLFTLRRKLEEKNI